MGDEIYNMTDNTKYEKGTLGWLREQQKIKAKKDGFDNVDDWLRWKSDPFNILEKKYGNEFADWARKNKGKVPNKWLNAGCKTEAEYQNKCAQKRGFKDHAESAKEWAHETGRNLPKEFNENCSVYFGEFTESLMVQTFEGAAKMPPNNPGFDWTCKRGDKIDNKGSCLVYLADRWAGRWEFYIDYNNIADWFILSAWDNRDSLNPLHVWIFHKNDIIRGKIFWRRSALAINNTTKGLREFKKWEVTDRLDKLKELCNRIRQERKDDMNDDIRIK